MHTSEGMRPGRPPQMDVSLHAVGRPANRPDELNIQKAGVKTPALGFHISTPPDYLAAARSFMISSHVGR
jgi:hypothetical protein